MNLLRANADVLTPDEPLESATRAASNGSPKGRPGVPSKAVFVPEDYFVLRAPLAPVTDWTAQDPCTRDRALAHLRVCWENDGVREAIYLASSSLFARLNAWDWQLNDDKDRKLAQALYRYVSRMCTRSTPFGLFASVSLGRLGEAAALDIADPRDLRRHTRLDTAVVSALGEHFAGNRELRSRLRVRRNDFGHAVGGRWHYVEWELKQNLRVYRLSSVDFNRYLDLALRHAAGDGCDIGTIVAALCDLDSELDQDGAHDYVDALIASCLLIPSLEACITGRGALPAMIDELKVAAPDADSTAALCDVHERLDALDRAGLGRPPQEYAAIADALVPFGATERPDRLVQVDLYRDTNGLCLPTAVGREIAWAAEVYLSLSARRRGPLDEFCKRFNRRYEGRRVPLLEALDEEAGIGSSGQSPVPSALLEGVPWDKGHPAVDETSIEALLLSRWSAVLAQGGDEIVLEAKDLPTLDEAQRTGLPPSLSAMITLLAPDTEALQRGDYQIFFHGMAGPSAANMLGRFCVGHPALTQCVRNSLACEAQTLPEEVFAEIVHLPQDRMGNIVSRPLLREYEIPVLGRSGADADKRIGLDDLDIEVRGQRVLLWSRRLGKRVIPRMSNAHNYGANALGVYRFLCEVQHQGVTGSGFKWGNRWPSLSRLPRIRCGRVVIEPAQWRIRADDASAVLAAGDAQRVEAIKRMREALGLPRHVGIVERDNVLAIDFDNVIAVDAFIQELRSKGRLHLVELSIDPRVLCVGNEQARFAHEIILPLRCPARVEENSSPKPRKQTRLSDLRARFAPPSAVASDVAATRERYRLPGSDWLYYRIYGGASLLDRALSDTLAPLAEALREEGCANQWFFLRYGDPEWHLRLRFHGEPSRLATEVVPRMAEVLDTLRRQGSIVVAEMGTYERELERYGGPIGMSLSERWFSQDSRRIARLLAIVRGRAPASRWQLAVACLIRDLRDFGLNTERLGDLFTYLASGFRDEFGMHGARLATLGQKYREYAPLLRTLCAGGLPDPFDDEQVQTVLDADADERRAIAAEFQRAAGPGGGLWTTPDRLLPSLVHMSCNRWFASNGRAHEMVLYELIRRGWEAHGATPRTSTGDA